MKPLRQLYLALFLVDCLNLALLFFPQLVVSFRLPTFFGTMGASLTVTIIYQIIRTRKEGTAFSRLIPAFLVILICLSHVVALFVLGGTPVTGGSPAFLFYLITTLANMALSAVGFFLKQAKKMPVS